MANDVQEWTLTYEFKEISKKLEEALAVLKITQMFVDGGPSNAEDPVNPEPENHYQKINQIHRITNDVLEAATNLQRSLR